MATVMGRRSVLAGMAAAAVSRGGQAEAEGLVGLPCGDALPNLLGTLAAIPQGDGPDIHVLVSPLCARSAEVVGMAAGLVGVARFRWVPFTWGAGNDAEALAGLVEEGTMDALGRFLSGARARSEPGPLSRQVASIQDGVVRDAVSRAAWAVTGRPLAAPTFVCRLPGSGGRLVRGAPRAGDLAALAAAAAGHQNS